MLLLVFKEAYVRKTLWEFQLKMLSGSQVIQSFLSKFHPNCQLANELDWQKQVKLQLDITTFEVVKIFSLNFQDFFKSLNSVREPILKRFKDREVKTFQKKLLFWHGMTHYCTFKRAQVFNGNFKKMLIEMLNKHFLTHTLLIWLHLIK